MNITKNEINKSVSIITITFSSAEEFLRVIKELNIRSFFLWKDNQAVTSVFSKNNRWFSYKYGDALSIVLESHIEDLFAEYGELSLCNKDEKNVIDAAEREFSKYLGIIPMDIKDTVVLQDAIMQRYAHNSHDEEIIRTLCFARNIAEKVAYHFNNTNNKVEFYRSVMNDNSIAFSEGYKALIKYYSYLMY